jgi:hypothetical protein
MTGKSRMQALAERVAKEQKNLPSKKNPQGAKVEGKETPEMRERRRIAVQKLKTFIN